MVWVRSVKIALSYSLDIRTPCAWSVALDIDNPNQHSVDKEIVREVPPLSSHVAAGFNQPGANTTVKEERIKLKTKLKESNAMASIKNPKLSQQAPTCTLPKPRHASSLPRSRCSKPVDSPPDDTHPDQPTSRPTGPSRDCATSP